MANPKIFRVHVDVERNLLEVGVERDVTDSVAGVGRERKLVSGPLNTLAGLAALRSNVLAWVQTQTGYGGTIDVAP